MAIESTDISLATLRINAGAICQSAAQGQTIYITDHDRRIAKITAIAPKIIRAAIRTSDGNVYHLPPPARHQDILLRYGEINGERGFLINGGKFVNSREAVLIAKTAAQILPRGQELSTEDLW